MFIVYILIIVFILFLITKVKIKIISEEIDKKLTIIIWNISIRVNINKFINDINDHTINKFNFNDVKIYRLLTVSVIKNIKIDEISIVKKIDKSSITINMIYYSIFEYIKNMIQINSKKTDIKLLFDENMTNNIIMHFIFEFRIYNLFNVFFANVFKILKIRKEMI